MTLRFLAALAVLAAGLAPAAGAEVRSATFRSAALGRDVAYVVDLPPSYDSSPARRYPVVYALHGLFEGPGFWERRGLAPILARLRQQGAVPEFLVVAADGGNSFFVNGPTAATRTSSPSDLVAHVEKTYRVVPGRDGPRPARHLDGRLRGAAHRLRAAALFRAVATHSAMLLEQVPSTDRAPGAGTWPRSARSSATRSTPRCGRPTTRSPSPRKVDPKTAPALYFDCGTEDRYGLAAGNRDLDTVLNQRRSPTPSSSPRATTATTSCAHGSRGACAFSANC